MAAKSSAPATLVVGALAGLLAGGAVGTYATTPGAREAITTQIGDTLQWRFSIRTDSILVRVAANAFACVRPGTSMTFGRTYRGNSTQQVTADSVAVTCVAPIDTTRTAALRGYVNFHTDANGLVVGDSVSIVTAGETVCVFWEALDALGRPRTGRPLTALHVSDTTVANVIHDSTDALPRGLTWPQACPDTTVDIQKLEWSIKPPPAGRTA